MQRPTSKTELLQLSQENPNRFLHESGEIY